MGNTQRVPENRSVASQQAPEQPPRVSSVEEYLRQVDRAFQTICPRSPRQCQLWYRGQGSAAFPLLPSIARPPFSPELEIVTLSKFKSFVIPYVAGRLPAPPLPNGIPGYWNWLFEMQHYGVPTRLLDWSLDALVGLYFAVHQAPGDVGKDAAVWVLNPVTLNQAFSFHSFLKPGYIPNVEDPSFNLFFGPGSQILQTDKPAAAIGPQNSTRIVAQRGTFTVFPLRKSLTALDQFPDAGQYLVKIVIAGNAIPRIIEQLNRYGITRIALFPEIQSIANEITLEMREEGFLPPETPVS